MTVLLATCADLPDGEPGAVHLMRALAARGVEATWADWTDPEVDWSAAELIAVRSTWDYHERLTPFVEWARRVGHQTALLNGADVFAWNADKAYLCDLQVPAVPTRLLDESDRAPGIAAAIREWGPVVVKRRTSAGGLSVAVIKDPADPQVAALPEGPWIVQPLVESIRTRGEISVFVIGGAAVSQVDKLPSGGEIRVHEEYGGASRMVPLDPAATEAALAAIAEASGRFGRPIDYGRVDLLEHEGRLVVSELELIEPGLYLDVDPVNAEPFAALVAARLP